MGRDSKKANHRPRGVFKKAIRYRLKFDGNSIWQRSVNEEALLQSLSQLGGPKNIVGVSIRQIVGIPNGDKRFTIEINGRVNDAVKKVVAFKRTIKNLGLTIQSCDIV